MKKPKFKRGQVVAIKIPLASEPKYFKVYGTRYGIQNEYEWRNGYFGHGEYSLRPLTKRETAR